MNKQTRWVYIFHQLQPQSDLNLVPTINKYSLYSQEQQIPTFSAYIKTGYLHKKKYTTLFYTYYA